MNRYFKPPHLDQLEASEKDKEAEKYREKLLEEEAVLKQLKKIQADISILGLLMASRVHRQVVLSTMDKAKLFIDTTPEQLVGLVFPGVECREKWVPVVLVDTGSAINVCPSLTIYAIGLKPADFVPTAQLQESDTEEQTEQAAEVAKSTESEFDISELEKFNKVKPPIFLGGIESLKAETWLPETEKIFEVFPCSETQKVFLATYTLKEEARRWWMLIRDNSGIMMWSQFKVIFYEKYFPQCFRDRKVSEFQELKQGKMSIVEYEAKFTKLAKFAPHMVDTDYKKAQKFEGGLNLDVFDRVGVLKLPTYVDELDRALMVEANLATMKQAKAPTT
ncbi:uncharacterized protein LOC114296667 [Camellia sinensis]|uniref:uncharacterized protein LOC114296667 n=1 Tax=Camellia sinensis TaxID=4442 RepID=UPI00103557A6|nr:uncharacterized protein LOC114296667 [Camellia sinensis]